MGLLFNKKLSDGNVVSRKSVLDKDIDKEDIRNIGRKLGFTRAGARQKFQEILSRSQSGGISREEIHSGLQELILQEKVTEEQAMRMARELGLEEKRFRYFEDISETKAARETPDSRNEEELKKIKDRELKIKLDKAASLDKKNIGSASGQKPGDNSGLSHDSQATKPKPAALWNILNNSRN